jgi:RNA polymerase sigma-70 factor (ECF subfamily)
VAIEPWAIELSADGTTGPDVEPASDEALIREMIAGSEDALASLYDRYVNAVFAGAMRTGRDRWIAAEVVQETFLALWNRAELFDPARGALLSWLLAIARNRTIDHLRAASRHDRAAAFSSFGADEPDGHSTAEWLAASGELLGAARPEPVPDVALSAKEDRASIEAAVASLEPAERDVIVLAYDSGLSQSEIAARLGLPIGTVKTRTRRALRRLRERLEGSGASAVGPVGGRARASVEAVLPAQCAPCQC